MKLELKKYTPDNYKGSLLCINILDFGQVISNKEAFKVGQKMINLMKEENGQGLAANQVNILSPIIVMNINGKPKILYRPVLQSYTRKYDIYKEGCLSFHGLALEVARPLAVIFSAVYRPNGKRKTFSLSGQEAQVFMHEYEHLLGVTIVNHMKTQFEFTAVTDPDTKIRGYNKEREELLKIDNNGFGDGS